MHIGKSRRKDAAANGKHLRGYTDGFGKIAGNVGERSKKEITEIVAAEAATGVETILKETAQQGFIVGQSDHAVANIAGRKDAIFAAKAAGAAAIIGNCDNSGEIGDGPLESGVPIAAANDVFLQAAQQRGKTGAATQRNDAQAWGDSGI